MSVAIENFIKVVYQLEQKEGLDTRPGTVAKALGISSAAATDMSRKLAVKNLVKYKKYRELKLTGDGKKMALHVIRKHRLWEAFLFRVFDMTLHEIHREAELLEHQTSDFLTEKISRFLGDPETDPHGEPIPDSHGSIEDKTGQLALAFATSGRYYVVSGLISPEKEFHDFCTKNGISIGTKIKVTHRYEKIAMTEIQLGGKKILLNKEFSSLIYVREKISELHRKSQK